MTRLAAGSAAAGPPAMMMSAEAMTAREPRASPAEVEDEHPRRLGPALGTVDDERGDAVDDEADRWR